MSSVNMSQATQTTDQQNTLQMSRAAVHGLTAERLRDVLIYEPETGLFRKANKPDAKPVGSLDPAGYRQILVDGVLYKAHRLAVLYMTGEMPISALPVDHLNRVRDDNRWSNLRVCTATENVANQSRPGSYSRTPYSLEHAACGPTLAAVAMIRSGLSLRAAAAAAGVALSTLVRACQRAGIVLPRGRRPKSS